MARSEARNSTLNQSVSADCGKDGVKSIRNLSEGNRRKFVVVFNDRSTYTVGVSREFGREYGTITSSRGDLEAELNCD